MPVYRYKFHRSIKMNTVPYIKIKACPPSCDCTEEAGCTNVFERKACPPMCKNCSNQNFRSSEVKVEVKECGEKGMGLFAVNKIEAGRFVIPFIGEVITKIEQEDRRRKYVANRIFPNYFGTGVYTVDATAYGNDAKYCNHSCDPNMVAERWKIHNAPRNFNAIGFVANRNIEAGDELTINYGNDYSTIMWCKCQSENCAGIVGQKPTINLKKMKIQKKKSQRIVRKLGRMFVVNTAAKTGTETVSKATAAMDPAPNTVNSKSLKLNGTQHDSRTSHH